MLLLFLVLVLKIGKEVILLLFLVLVLKVSYIDIRLYYYSF